MDATGFFSPPPVYAVPLSTPPPAFHFDDLGHAEFSEEITQEMFEAVSVLEPIPAQVASISEDYI